MVYTPAEDSFMLSELVKVHSFGDVLDMGTGSGIQAISAFPKAKSVTAVDIDKSALILAKKNAKDASVKIKFIHSNLFSNLKNRKFDTIIFNPPYLPQDEGVEDIALYGGRKGFEIIELFLSQASNHLSPKGIILLLFSSHTKKDIVENLLLKFGFVFEKLGEKSFFFEKLFVYKIKKSDFLLKLDKLNLRNAHLFAKGHRGFIYKANLKNKIVAIKTKNPASGAISRIEIEIAWLKRLNKQGIGPKLLFSNSEFFVYDFVEGEFIHDFVRKNKAQDIKKVLISVLLQCRKLDELNLSKEEMHHPFKHIIVGKKVVLIDFERTHFDQYPKNVTQFCQFLLSNTFLNNLNEKGISIDRGILLSVLKQYKSNQSKKNFDKIRSSLNF